jgi:hypothetical protein
MKHTLCGFLRYGRIETGKRVEKMMKLWYNVTKRYALGLCSLGEGKQRYPDHRGAYADHQRQARKREKQGTNLKQKRRHRYAYANDLPLVR